MTDYDDGHAFGVHRLHDPLVETIQLAQAKGESYLEGTVAGLIEAARKIPPSESFRGSAKNVIRHWREFNRNDDPLCPAAKNQLNLLGSAVDRMDAAVFEFEG